MPAFEAETYLRLAAELSKRGIGFTLFSDQTRWVEDITIPATFLREFRSAFQGSVVLTGDYLKENGRAALDAGEADLIGIGKPFLANPELVERLPNDLPPNEWNFHFAANVRSALTPTGYSAAPRPPQLPRHQTSTPPPARPAPLPKIPPPMYGFVRLARAPLPLTEPALRRRLPRRRCGKSPANMNSCQVGTNNQRLFRVTAPTTAAA
jgi:hypothetical protein